ncbi:hypothetical protein MLD38_034598 [Melastoma candidum]|uniref:Uncharacterized protein n=1 Tax=Melastoma candidum TaxID=119954 RepID=A0ACB9MCQ2_9MYRT|nr:hypothetical protein MLD38_034598 [Melastoma candidum]
MSGDCYFWSETWAIQLIVDDVHHLLGHSRGSAGRLPSKWSLHRGVGTKESDANTFGAVESLSSKERRRDGEVQNIMEGIKGNADDPASYFFPLTFDSNNFGGFHELGRPPFEDSVGAFSFLVQGSRNYPPKRDCRSSSNNLSCPDGLVCR